MGNLVVSFIVLSILVLIHEFGHFIVGKKSGIGVVEFALGLPFTKPLWSKKVGDGMKISLYPVLFGGFVKLLGEEGPIDKGSGQIGGMPFYKAPVWTRIAVVVAGVLMNLVLGIVAFYVFLGISNFRVLVPRLASYNFASPNQTAIVVTRVAPGSPAEKLGVKAEQVILAVDGKNFSDLPGFQNYIKSHGGQEVEIKLTDLEYDAMTSVRITPRVNPPKDQGALGIGIGEAVAVSFKTPTEKAFSGVLYAGDMFVYNIKVLSSLVGVSIKSGNAEAITENVSGPIGIFNAIGQILDLGGVRALRALLNLLGLLSLSLAFMNILPIPAMDGGRLVFLLLEAVTGKRFPQKIENIINQAGMFLLLILIGLISYNDIIKKFAR